MGGIGGWRAIPLWAASGPRQAFPNQTGKRKPLAGAGFRVAFWPSLPASCNRKTDDSALPETIVTAESGYLNAAGG